VASSAALPASADRNSLNDKKRQQQQVRQQRALIASQIDTLKASDRQIDSALKAINANVQGTQAELESAQRALDQANHDAAVARQGIEDATSSITQLQTTLAGLAVDSYVHPLGDTMLAVLNTTNISDAAQKRAFLTVVHQRDADVADQIKQAREDLTVQQQLAEDAAARAEASRQTITGELEKLQAAKQQQLQFEDKVQQRLDAALSPSRCSNRRTSSSRARSRRSRRRSPRSCADGAVAAALRCHRSATST
jgi:peptidoglycan hydrolase CwlO-like protein